MNERRMMDEEEEEDIDIKSLRNNTLNKELYFNDHKILFSWLSMESTYTNTLNNVGKVVDFQNKKIFEFIQKEYLKLIKGAIKQILLLNSIINSIESTCTSITEYGDILKCIYNPKNDSYQIFLSISDQIHNSNANPIPYLNLILSKSYFRVNDIKKDFEIVKMADNTDSVVYLISIYFENSFIISNNQLIFGLDNKVISI